MVLPLSLPSLKFFVRGEGERRGVVVGWCRLSDRIQYHMTMKGFLDCSPVLVSGWSLFSSWSLEFCLRRSGVRMMLSVLVVYFSNSSESWLLSWRADEGPQILGLGGCWFMPMSHSIWGGRSNSCCCHVGKSNASTNFPRGA